MTVGARMVSHSQSHFLSLQSNPIALVKNQIESHTWSLNVTDNATGGVVHELDTDLGDTTTGACSFS